MLRVRYAESRDFGFVGQDGYLPTDTLQRKISTNEVIIAESDGVPVGYLRFEYLWSTLPYIALIRVMHGHRGRGVGRALLGFLQNELSAAGHKILISSSEAHEPEPQAWHKRMGFVECGRLRDLNQSGADEVFFRKELVKGDSFARQQVAGSNVMSTYPLVDLDLARRLERSEGTANAAFVDARALLEAEIGAAWTDVAGVYAMFDGVDSPITQTFGLGIFEDIGAAEFDRIEAFFETRGAPVCHEVCPLIPGAVLALLNARGYQPIEMSSVLVRPTAGNLPSAPDSIQVRRIGMHEIDVWSDIAARGWHSESAELAEVVAGFGRVIGNARGAHCFLAYRAQEPIAAGALVLNSDVALLAGASTIPEGRKQGAQLALLEARLRFAREHDAALAMMVAQPGSGSQRNAERQGFRIAYTRTKWQRMRKGIGHG
jgi:GNAT superfamily N-acetyltransferase